MSWTIGRLTLQAGCAERDESGAFWWWYWLPFTHSNGGRAREGEVIDVSLHWLCFWASVIVWKRRPIA